MLNNYIDFLKVTKSKKTIDSYSSHVKSMLDFVGKPESAITEADMNEWYNSLSGFSSATNCLKITAVKNYFDYLVKIHVITSNPANVLEKPVRKNKEKHYVTEEMIDNMIACADNFRDKAILMLLKKNGLRVDELINLKRKDYEDMKKYNTRYIKIIAKGDKERFVYFTDDVVSLIDIYLASRNDDCDKLFVSHWGGAIHSNNLSQTWKHLAKKAGIPFWEEFSNHYLRVACACIYDAKGVSVTQIRDILGHSSIAVTNTYLKTNPDMLLNTVMAI